MALSLAFLAFLPSLRADGSVNCPCLDDSWSVEDTHANSIVNGQLQFETAGTTYYYPLDYGKGCKAHDDTLAPVCSQSYPPSWCAENWCYVDKDDCDTFNMKSQFFPDEDELYYSYGACSDGRSSNSFEEWAGTSQDGTTKLLGTMKSYLESSRSQIESAYTQLSENSQFLSCETSDMCPCLECTQNAKWGQKIDMRDVGTLLPANDRLASCMAKSIALTYRNVGAKEGNESHIGYQYYGDQASAGYVGWPNVEWCPNDYDPRFRPWYASGATGPKDVVIVVDVSGSMSTASRSRTAKKAVKAILDTLSWKDFASIVLFNGYVAGVYSNRLVSVTDANRQRMKDWVDSGSMSWEDGSTNFVDALFQEDASLPGAFGLLSASVAEKQTSMCQKAIMFLTDGEADFSESDYAKAVRKSEELDAVIFTYALGSGADTSVTKRLACENRGIFYQVADNADLGKVMASYYEYFAMGQESCDMSFVQYDDAVTGKELIAACLAMYDRGDIQPSLLGVTCMDLNMMADVAAMERKAGWHEMISIASDMSKKCRPLDLKECHRQKLRLKHSTEHNSNSVCSGQQVPTTNTDCDCKEAGCKDNPTFVDGMGYYCDTWVGDTCDYTTGASWGYTTAQMDEVKQQCQHSCGLCPWYETCPYDSTSCVASSIPTEARACMTREVSGVDIQGCTMTCHDGSNSLYVDRECPFERVSSTSGILGFRAAWVLTSLGVLLICAEA